MRGLSKPGSATLTFALTLLACDDPLVEPEEIVDLRVLAASAEVVTDPPRATPRGGEEVTVRVLVAGGEGPPDATSAILACRAAPTTTGLPICREELARASTSSPSRDVPTITFTVPPDLGEDRVSLIGVACDGGAPVLSLDAERVRCSGGAERAAPFVFDVVVAATNAEENANPTLFEGAVELAGKPWVDHPFDPCDPEADVIYRVPAGSHHQVRLDATGGAEAGAGFGAETLAIAHYVTGGDLERHFSIVEAGGDPVVDVGWRAPRSAPPGGSATHFYAVVRDGRGGATWAHRAVCVLE